MTQIKREGAPNAGFKLGRKAKAVHLAFVLLELEYAKRFWLSVIKYEKERRHESEDETTKIICQIMLFLFSLGIAVGRSYTHTHTHTHTHTPVSYTHLTLPTNHRV